MSINRNKYQSYIFGNGRVVLVENKIINEAIDHNKEILIICNAWSGGYAHAIGAKKDIDPDFGECWNMYGYDIVDTEFNATDLDKFYRVIISSGEKIVMKTGGEANRYLGSRFFDWNTSEERIIDDFNCDENSAYEKRVTVNPCATVCNLNCKYTEDHKPDYTDWEERVWALINIGILPKDAVKYIPHK